MKVYVVIARENVYEPADYVEKVFALEDDAAKYCKDHNPQNRYFGCYSYEFEEVEVE